jgi:hypothetical protein
MSQLREMMSQEEDAPEPTTATTSTERPRRKRKRLGLKRGERGLNQFLDDTYASQM